MPYKVTEKGFVRFSIVDSPTEESIPFNSATTLQRPEREPIEIPSLLRSYYENKSIMHIGCQQGDFLPIFSKYAKKVFAHEWRGKYHNTLFEREDIKSLPNVHLLQDIGTSGTANAGAVMDINHLPHITEDVDVFYHWGFPAFANCNAEEIIYFIECMEQVGRKGLLCWYGGLSPKGLKTTLEAGAVNPHAFSGAEFQQFFCDESIDFFSIEASNSEEVDSLTKTNQHTILMKEFGK